MSKWDDDPKQLTASERAKLEKRNKPKNNQKRRKVEAISNSTSTSTPALVIPPPSRSRSVHNYEIINKIESGTYGIVYRAKEIATNKIVAIKKLKSLETSYGFSITSLREITALQELSQHPNIVNLREVVVGDKPSDVYIVMDFIEHDLRSLLQSMNEPFLLSEIKTILSQILSATAAIHDKWLLHRDLKTSNILMTNRGVVKIADFGLTRKLDNQTSLTQTVVTLWYRAPELLLGSTTYGPEIDMWSIGCIFAELLTKTPFLQGKSESDQLTKIFSQLGPPSEDYWAFCKKTFPASRTLSLPTTDIPAIASQFSQLPPAGIDLLQQLLAYSPSERITPHDALSHPFFTQDPLPKPQSMFPSFPSKGGLENPPKMKTPNVDQARQRWNS